MLCLPLAKRFQRHLRNASEEVFPSSELNDLVDGTFMSLVAIEAVSGEVVGFLALDRSLPGDPRNAELQGWAKGELKSISYDESTSLYVRYILTAPGFEDACILALLQRALVLAPHTQSLIAVASLDLAPTPLKALAGAATVLSSRAPGAHIYEIPRAAIVPRVLVRRAREEDHDDLLPVLEVGSRICPPLAELPVSETEQEYALARLIARQDEHNCILVAEVNGRPVGVMALTANLETSQLLAAFDLHEHDGLTKPEAYDQLYVRAEQLARMRAMEAAAANGDEFDASAPLPAVALSAAMLDILSDPAEADQLPLNSFAVSLLCVDPGYEFAVHELLRSSFAAFPAMDYCLVSVPHSAPQPPALSDFTRISPLSGVAFPDLLFVFHRNGLSGPLRTRLARADDRMGVEALVAGSADESDLLEAFDLAIEDPSACQASVTVCDGEIVAVTVLGRTENPAKYSGNYRINSLIDCELQPEGAFARLRKHTVDPIFAHRTRDILADTCALTGRRYTLYHHEPEAGHLPEFARHFLQIPGRRAGAAQVLGAKASSDTEPSTALFLFAPRMAYSPRRHINSRIVFVGGSTCAMAAIEALLVHPALSFNTVTLISPQGLRASESIGGGQGRFTPEEINRAGFPGRVTLVEARVTGLDRENREVLVDAGFGVPYDILVFATGLRAAEAERLREGQEELLSSRIVTGPEDIPSTLENGQPVESINQPGPSAAKHGGDYGALVVGEGPQVLEALDRLLALGVDPSRILVAPPTPDNFVTAAKAASQEMGDAGGVLQRINMLKPQERDGHRCYMSVSEARPAHADDLRHGLIVRFEHSEGGAVSAGPMVRCHLLVVCDRTDVSRATFRAVSSNSLVFDGRVVVDGLFRTQDPSVMAVGPCAKFSRGVRGAANRPHELMDKREIGEELARSIAMQLDNSGATAAQNHSRELHERERRAPLLLRPALRDAPLPGTSLRVFLAALASAVERPGFGNLAFPGRVVRSLQYGQSLALVGLTTGGTVDRILYCGPEDEASMQRLWSLVGMHQTYFGTLLDEDDNPGLLAALQSSMFEAYFHESFVEVRRSLLTATLAGAPAAQKKLKEMAATEEEAQTSAGAIASEELLGEARAAMLEFCRIHLTDLANAGYVAIPQLSINVSSSLVGSKLTLRLLQSTTGNWYNERPWQIGFAVTVGIFLLLVIFTIVWVCCMRRQAKENKQAPVKDNEPVTHVTAHVHEATKDVKGAKKNQVAPLPDLERRALDKALFQADQELGPKLGQSPLSRPFTQSFVSAETKQQARERYHEEQEHVAATTAATDAGTPQGTPTKPPAGSFPPPPVSPVPQGPPMPPPRPLNQPLPPPQPPRGKVQPPVPTPPRATPTMASPPRPPSVADWPPPIYQGAPAPVPPPGLSERTTTGTSANERASNQPSLPSGPVPPPRLTPASSGKLPPLPAGPLPPPLHPGPTPPPKA